MMRSWWQLSRLATKTRKTWSLGRELLAPLTWEEQVCRQQPEDQVFRVFV